jgi:hypothetical protein
MWPFKHKRVITVARDRQVATITISSSDKNTVQALHAIVVNKMHKPRQLDINTDASVTDVYSKILKVLGQVK